MAETLRRGSAGGAVREAQRMLQKAGFNPGLIDGTFGAKMESAVKNFQAAKNVSDTAGMIGDQTWAKLRSAAGISG